MYEIFYNFTAEPFRLSPDHRFCFEHNSYGKARAYLAYAFKRAEGFVMITGRPGTGKTTLIGELVESLSTDKVVTANLVCTQLQADDLLKTVAYSFGISPAQVGKAELLQHLSTLLHGWHREGRRALLVVDEAQDLSSSAMEELRLLTNIQFGGQPLLQIFLLGQPELRDLILSRGMEQVHQRIVAASHIEGLEEDETEAYVMHRLSRVGWKGDPAIDRAVFPLIHRFSEGVPRRINLICSRLFLLGSVEERHAIEVRDVSVVIGELQAENLAAGTGISREDFQNSVDPQWVPVPGSEQPTPPPHVPPAGTASSTTVESDLADTSIEAKKKDNLSHEALVLDSDSATSDISSEYFQSVHADPRDAVPEVELESDSEEKLISVTEEILESEPEDHLGHEPEDDIESVAEADPVLSSDVQRVAGYQPGTEALSPVMAASTGAVDDASNAHANFTINTSGQVVAPAPRKPLMVMALLLVAAIVLVLLLKTCVVTQDGGVSLEQTPWAPAEDSQSLAPVAEPVQFAAVANAPPVLPVTSRQTPESETVLPVSPASDTAGEQQELVPMVVEAGLRILIPAATAEDILPVELPEDIRQPSGAEVASGDLSLDKRRTVPATETAGPQSWEETILVSFPFDSDDLVPESHRLLERAASILRDNDASEASITGFTDSQGDSQYNLLLSRKRADAVERYLVDAGIARERLHVEGRGVLSSPVEEEGLASGFEDPMEPYRIVQIKLVGEG